MVCIMKRKIKNHRHFIEEEKSYLRVHKQELQILKMYPFQNLEKDEEFL